MQGRHARMLAVAAAAALVLLGCGDDGDDDGGEVAPTTAPAQLTTPETVADTGDPEPEVTPTTTAAPTGETYEVQQGDTLWDIAQRYGTTVDALVGANDIEDESQIFPGDELVIPAGD